jgi:peptide/nickel transport system permease protein
VIVERAFNYPGLGQEIVSHAVLKDYAVVQAGAMVIGATYLTATVIADISYSLLNPRVRLGGTE